jgi:hypothetical protein
MKFTYRKNTEWHRWFAWYPVDITPHQFVWLEWVNRKKVFCVGDAEYVLASSELYHYIWVYSCGAESEK